MSDGAYHDFCSISENFKNRLNLTLIYFQLIGVVAACCLLKKNDVDDDDGLKRAAKFWCVKNFAHWPWSTRISRNDVIAHIHDFCTAKLLLFVLTNVG